MDATMTKEETTMTTNINKFGPNAMAILEACKKSPQNPYRFFGRKYRRSWGYGYFDRLHKAGLIKLVDTPIGCRGYHWYMCVEK